MGISVFANWAFSFMKVEKVVNPPQKPTVRNSLMEGDSQSSFSDSARKKPMSRQPPILQINVPSGKFQEKKEEETLLMKKRITLPNPPPKATSNTDLIMTVLENNKDIAEISIRQSY